MIKFATHRLSPPSVSPRDPPTHSFSSLAYTWFFDSFLLGCDVIHEAFEKCNGRSLQTEADIDDEAWMYEGEGWERGTHKRWDEKGKAIGWIELVGECETLLSNFDQLFSKFEKVYRPVTFEMHEKVNYSFLFNNIIYDMKLTFIRHLRW